MRPMSRDITLKRSWGLEAQTPSLPSSPGQFWGEEQWPPESEFGLQMQLFEPDAEDPS